ncbi:hypothetical protein [Polluticoccus soli]|uniref:hypothetical protein n=1 Tax=Polluticoccus soli TaxID=3034150 RepID=UPI0023E2EF64|nr:hypothetical protein [Flavipsychrobacter sp. JY13-12]
MSNGDDRYLRYAEQCFSEVKICPKVFEEVGANWRKNTYHEQLEETFLSIINGRLRSYIEHSSFDKECDFVEKELAYQKKNGEFFSISLALFYSRLGHEVLRENLLKVHFTTDDAPVKAEFGDFYARNLIGSIIDSIDLLTMFCLKGYIGKGELHSFCTTLKLLYSNVGSKVLQEVKAIKDSGQLNSKKLESQLTKIVELISDIDEHTRQRIQDLASSQELKAYLKDNIKLSRLLSTFLESESREKIPMINERINKLSRVWELEY